jgi:hypothetical protein
LLLRRRLLVLVGNLNLLAPGLGLGRRRLLLLGGLLLRLGLGLGLLLALLLDLVVGGRCGLGDLVVGRGVGAGRGISTGTGL